MVTDEDGVEIDRFYASVNIGLEEIEKEWVKENVYPYLKNADIYFDSEDDMLENFWAFWMKYREDSICIAYVQYPVENRLFTRCVMKNEPERAISQHASCGKGAFI